MHNDARDSAQSAAARLVDKTRLQAGDASNSDAVSDHNPWQQLIVGAHASVRPALAQLAAGAGCSTDDAALGCLIALLSRRVQQATIRVATGAPMQVLACAVTDDTTLADILNMVSNAGDRAAAANGDDGCDAVFGAGSASGGSAALVLEVGGGEDMSLRLSFDAQRFSAERMQEFLQQYQQLIVQAATSPSVPLLEYSLVTERGRSFIPDPTAAIDRPRYPLLGNSVLACAAQHPERIAVSQADREWSYAQLARSSAILAASLGRGGFGAGDVIAVSGARGYAAVSAMLGVFRSGAALVNIDPKLPLDRQKVILRQAQAQCVVCVGPECSLESEGIPIVRLDATSGEVIGADAQALLAVSLPHIDAAAAAFIFFTSGSTGTPKGVVGTHEGLAHFLDWQRRTFDIGRDDRASHITALSFDAVLRDVFLVLTTGGTLCIPSEADILDPGAILKWMQDQGITLVHSVPSLARAWFNHVPPAITLPRLRWLFLSGEPLTDVLVDRFRAAFGRGPTVVNLYGPTETTMVKCYHLALDIEPGVQPIGVPMPQTQVLVLNRRGRICGLDETGEIVIRTPFRTLGYLNDPQATARSFVANPFRNDPQDLLYRTGDNGRYRSDGVLQIAGRIDNQVKIRGIRVEPGEIETTLCHHPLVRDAAVVAFENPAGGKYLAAYVALKERAAPASHALLIGEIRSFLQAKLPEHMVPASLSILEALPLNANNKVNKAALPAPHETADSSPQDSDLPATERERQLVAIWRSALGRTQVGVNDSFGALGGDSLTSIGALMAMKRIGVPDDLARGIFEGLTIQQIAGKEAEGGATSSAFSRQFAHIESPIFVRAASITLVVAGHFGLADIIGNIKALLVVSGLSYARFQLHSIERSGGVQPVLRFMGRIALPTLLYTMFLQIAVLHHVSIESWFFIDNLIDPMAFVGSPWFIDLLLQCIALATIPLAVRRVRQFAVRKPYEYGLMFLAGAWLLSVIVPRFWNTTYLFDRVPQFLLWLMAYGWCAAYSDTYAKKIVSSILFVVLNAVNAEWFGWFPLCCGLLITWFSRIPVPLPRSVVSAFNAVAGASLFIYLTHFQFKSMLAHVSGHIPASVATAVALAGGIVVWKAWDFMMSFVSPRLNARSGRVAADNA